ncbi:unnamed protein product, partial [Iphiclides podalirius]
MLLSSPCTERVVLSGWLKHRKAQFEAIRIPSMRCTYFTGFRMPQHRQESIDLSFGGNPDDVTIAGYSAGSTSVDLLMLSEMAKGLFHKVIAESAANIAASAVQLDPVQNAKSYAKALGFDNVEDIYALENFYKTTPYDILTKPVPDGSTLPQWPPMYVNRSPHMALNKSLELKGPALQERAQFWDEIYQLYYKPPSPPPNPMTRRTDL